MRHSFAVAAFGLSVTTAAVAMGPEAVRPRASEAVVLEQLAILEEGVRPHVVTHHIDAEHAAVIAARKAEREAWLQEQGEGVLYAPGGPALPIYLNRWGGTYFAGYDDASNNISSIIEGASATVGPFQGTDTQWQTVLSCVQQQFAPFNVYVTDIEPTDGGYVEAVVGGTPDQIGQPFGVGGVAPYNSFACQVIDDAVVYAFADVYGTSANGLQSLCETVTQEVAHAFTLDHELLCEDPMTYLDGCGAKTFQNVFSPCGEYEERTCYCGDPAGQNSVQALLTLVGENEGVEPPPPPDDNGPPEVFFLEPEHESTQLADQPLVVKAIATDDAGLVSVQLIWHLSGTPMYCPGSEDTWSCTRSNDEYTWTIQVGGGLREFHLEARDIVGNTTVSDDRWVWLGASLDEERPEDDNPPEVTIISPAPFTVVPERDQVEIVATAYDAETGIIGAQLVYEGGFGTRVLGCPIQSDFFSCTIEGGTYTWIARTGRSDRTFVVQAIDYLGNLGESDPLPIVVDDNNVTPPFAEDGLEPNDTWDFPFAAVCGADLTLNTHPADPDWFTIDAPEGHKVSVELGGDLGDRLDLFVHVTPTSEGVLVANLHEEGTPNRVSFFMPPSGARVRVQPAGAWDGVYTLATSCEEPPPPPVTNDARTRASVC